MEDLSEKIEKTHVIMVTETWLESFARDFTTLAIFLAMWSVGYYAESPALQWAGVMLAMIVTFSRAMTLVKGKMQDSRMTPDEAREWLDRNFPREAQD